MASPLDRPDIAHLLASTPYADVAVDTQRGPHVTPAAFAAADGRIWVVSSRRTVRVRSVRRRHHAAVLVRNGDRAVLVQGAAAVLSVWPPAETVGFVMNSVTVARAATLYALRNVSLLLRGFLRDTIAGSGDLTVYDRVLVAVEPERGMLFQGDRLVHSWGRWRRLRGVATPSTPRAVPALRDLLAQLPPGVEDAVQRTESASLGWSWPGGVVVLPVLQASPDGEAVVPAAALDAMGDASRARACITMHNSESIRPSGFRGVVLRGVAEVARRKGARATVALAVERVSWWRGFRAGTVSAAASSDDRAA